MGAYWTIGPTDALKVFMGLVCVLVDRIGDNHGN